MRALCAAALLAVVVGLTPAVVGGTEPEYDGCLEQGYDSTDEPCGGGHQHSKGKRDERSIELARHRHRYLEEQIKQLNNKLAALSTEVEQLKKATAK